MMRCYGLDILRGVAAFLIVGCHLQLLNYTSNAHGLLRFCDMNVGVFAAVAGWLMVGGRFADRTQSTSWKQYCKRRLVRFLPSYLFWTIIFLIASAVFQLVVGGAVKPKYGEMRFWWNVVFWGGSATQLWFIPALLYTQMIYRAIASLMRSWMWLCLGVALVLVSQYWDSWYARYPLRVASFVALGYGLRILSMSIAAKRTMLPIGMIVCGLLLHCILGNILPCFVKDFIAVTLLLPGFALLPVKSVPWWTKIPSDTSLGVYMTHPLFTVLCSTVVKKMLPAPYGVTPTLSVWLLSYIASLAVTVVMLRNVMLRRLVQ